MRWSPDGRQSTSGLSCPVLVRLFFFAVLSLALLGGISSAKERKREQPFDNPRGRAIQQLSPAGQTELLTIIRDGELPDLRWPGFKDLQVEVEEFYLAIDYSLAWITSSAPTPQAKALIQLLESADMKGLNPEDYDSPRWPSRMASLQGHNSSSEANLLRFDLELTVSVMRYLSDLHSGRVSPRSMHFGLDNDDSGFDLSEFLRVRVVNADEMEAVLEGVEPQFPTYRRTLAALQTYLALAKSDDGISLPEPSKTVKPGDFYSGVPILARLLTRFGDLPPASATHISEGRYEGLLIDGVKRFQGRHGLEPNGQIDRATLKALNTPIKFRITQLQLTLERWRWLPRGFKLPAIFVNIPEFRLRAVDEDYRWALSMRIVVGKAYEHQTPVFSTELRSVTFRPSWNVPLAIQRDEMLLQIEANSSYLSANSYIVTDNNGAVVAADTEDNEVREKLRSGELHLRQEPGPENSLGLIRFDLFDPFDIYLHGTPATELFSRSRRDFSHGCIRVEDPLALAAWVLRDNPEWTPERIREVISGDTTVRVNIARPLPVQVVYGTAVVMEDGEIDFFDDIYGHDAALERALLERFLAPLP